MVWLTKHYSGQLQIRRSRRSGPRMLSFRCCFAVIAPLCWLLFARLYRQRARVSAANNKSMAVNSLQKQPASFGAGRRDKRLLTEERPAIEFLTSGTPAIRTDSMCTCRSPGRSGSKGNLKDAKAGLAKALTLEPEINSLT